MPLYRSKYWVIMKYCVFQHIIYREAATMYIIMIGGYFVV